MTARYLLDTNIVIYIRRFRPKPVFERFAALPVGAATMSVVTYGELAYGVAKGGGPKAPAILAALTELIPVLDLPASAGAAYGALRADLALRGAMIGNNDLWIAAHAIAGDAILVTNNGDEFSRVKGLRLENWAR